MSNYLIGSDLLSELEDVVGEAQYTDAFFAAKTEVDSVLAKADSSVNLVQHGAIAIYQAAEGGILEGFRRGVDTKDKALVDSATSAMKNLASTARAGLINPTTGEVKSQTKEAATQMLISAGGDLQKFKQDTENTLTWVKWIAIGAGVLLVLGVGGFYILPLVLRSKMRRY